LPNNWSKITKVLSFREKIAVSFFLAVIFVSLFLWVRYIYLQTTVPVPKRGGEYAEGIVGQPIYINPLLSQTSEADADLTQLIYSGLMKYDGKGNLVHDLAERYEISEDKKTYTFFLKPNVLWHDGAEMDADDVKFTIDILQDPAYKSPLRQSWQGVGVRKVDEATVEFTLEQPYFGFLNKLTLGILPKHIWENINPEKFTLADYNLRPVGTGPYSFSDIQKDSSGTIASVNLSSFTGYYDGEPFIPKITVNFYPEDSAAVEAYNQKEVNGLGNLPLERLADIKSKKSTRNHELTIPRFFSLFFNQTKSIVLANDAVRKALALAVDRDEIIEKVLGGKGTAIYSPFLPQMKEFNPEAEKNSFDLEKAKAALEADGWVMNDQKGVREKGGTELGFKILTIDLPELSQTAGLLEEQWKKIGADVEIEILTISDMQQNNIRPREYEALLFGQESSFDPDLYSFWHSSQKQDPGLNLSLFDNKKGDSLLEEARQEIDVEKRVAKYREFQTILAERIPAIFLFSPYYVYPVSDQLKGLEMKEINSPSWRFAEVAKWFIDTRRVKK
jgi:peptide/nickel transport system substrate-binding protein